MKAFNKNIQYKYTKKNMEKVRGNRVKIFMYQNRKPIDNALKMLNQEEAFYIIQNYEDNFLKK